MAARGQKGSTVTDPSHRRHVEIQADGQLTGILDVERLESAPVVRAELHVESGHLPPGSRARLDIPRL